MPMVEYFDEGAQVKKEEKNLLTVSEGEVERQKIHETRAEKASALLSGGAQTTENGS